MRKFLRPINVLMSAIIPDVLLMIVLINIYNLVSTDLTDKGREYWIVFSVLYFLSFVVTLIYVITRLKDKREVSRNFAIFRLVMCILLLLSTMYYSDTMFLWRVTSLFYDTSIAYVILICLMPSTIHMMWILVYSYMEKQEGNNRMKDILILITPPVLMYMLLNLDILSHNFFPLLFIIIGLSFGFLVIGLLQNGITKKMDDNKLLVGFLIFMTSLSGLMLNNSMGGIFGNFTDYRFYLLDVIVCMTLIIDIKEINRIRLLNYITKCMTYVFSLYFFIVFIPYIPLSFIGILIVGLGLLILVPTLLIFVHTRSIVEDFIDLKKVYSPVYLLIISIVSVMIIPTYTSIVIYKDRGVMQEAIDYVYRRDFNEKEISINLKGVKRSLNNMKSINNNGREDFLSIKETIPILTKAYNKWVLGGLSTTNERIEYLDAIYMNSHKPISEDRIDESRYRDVFIKEIETETKYLADEGYYESWIDLKIINNGFMNNEYDVEFQLDNSTFIKDYYLDVVGKRKSGYIVDKRAANWIYNRIRKVNRDPGILTYIDSNTISFRVFPFNKNQIRETGIKLIHKEPIDFTIEDFVISLKEEDNNYSFDAPINLNSGGGIVSKTYKKKLPRVSREKEYYFIIDASLNGEGYTDEYLSRTQDYIKENGIADDSIGAMIMQNYRSYNVGDKNYRIEGGLYLDSTIKSVLSRNYLEALDKQPIFIVVSDNFDKIIVSKDIDKMNFTAPEGLKIYNLKENDLIGYDLPTMGRLKIEEMKDVDVYKYTDINNEVTYLSCDDENSIVVKGFRSIEEEPNDFNAGLAQSIGTLHSELFPQDINKDSLDIIKSSIRSNVMSQLTSFIVLETEAQEKAMFKKQEKLLASDFVDEIDDEYTVMDEPSLLLILLIMLAFVIYRRKSISKEI